MSAGRPKDFDDNVVLDKAIEIFWKQGFEATNLEDLLATMGLGKGSMYHNFGNKREVFKLALNRFIQKFSDWFEKDIAEAKDPVAFIKEFFRSVPKQGLLDHRKGCFLGNSVAELACIDPSLEKIAVGHLERMEQTFYVHLKKAQQAGKLKSKDDPKLLARHLINLWNGLNITRRMYTNAKDLHELVEFQLKHVY